MMNWGSIPPEIAEEILQNLPVKSLIRFKSVCETWNSLISDSKFRKHYNSKPFCKRILLSSPSSGSRTFDYEKGSITQLNFPLVKIVGSSNGLICVSRDYTCQDFIIWNPTTGDSRNLPDPTIPLGDSFTYGFGYDSSGDDYKIVVATNCKDRLYKNRIAIEVFSLRKNSWTRIEDIIVGNCPTFAAPTIKDRVAVTCNGAVHWEIMWPDIIIVFHLYKEEAIALDTPFNCPFQSMRIGNIDGCLCISFPSHEYIEVWVMKEYGEL